jgi:hypothetical protein
MAVTSSHCLRLTRERPFEEALARELDKVLTDGLVARTGGTPGLPDFPALGTYDVSVHRRETEGYEVVVEVKWWGPPGVRNRIAPKRNETLWDILKIACSVNAGRIDFGYLVILAPDAAMTQEHVYSRLCSSGGIWETAHLCAAPERPMRYFDGRHFGVTRVPSSVLIRVIETVTFEDPCHDEGWSLRALSVEPDGSVITLPNALVDPSTSPRA